MQSGKSSDVSVHRGKGSQVVRGGYPNPANVIVDYERKYQRDNHGPFTVWIQTKRNFDAAISTYDSLSPYKVGKCICEKYKDVTVIERESKYRVEVTLKSREAANRLAEDKSLNIENCEVIIPPFRLSRKGIIRDVDVDITEEEILNGVESLVRVLAVKRIYRRNREPNNNNANEWIPTKSGVKYFPTYLLLFSVTSALNQGIAQNFVNLMISVIGVLETIIVESNAKKKNLYVLTVKESITRTTDNVLLIRKNMR